MTALSDSELATRAGTTEERIRLLCDIGVLARGGDGASFSSGDIQRVRLAETLDRSGIPLETIGKVIAAGDLSFGFLDLIFQEPAALTDTTYAELCEQLNLPFEIVLRHHEAVGLPRPRPEDRVREDDATMYPVLQIIRSFGLSDEAMARSARVYGENLRKIAQAETQFFHTYIEEPMLRSGISERQISEMSSQIGAQLQPLVIDLMLWLYRRHQEHYITEDIVEHVEGAIEEAGLARRRETRPPGIVFLDLAGYTRLTEERGDDAAAELAASLASLVQGSAAEHGGRPIKWLGDGVMFHFPDPAEGVVSSLEMVERAPRAGLPPAHVGVNAGPVVFRDGDYFGRTVNIAARISAKAGPGEVLATEHVVSAARPDGVRFEEVGPASLKGVAEPVPLFRAAREG